MLTDTAIKALLRKAAGAGRPIKKADSRGLVLYARPSGTGSWRWNYTRPDGLADTKVYGSYPEISLAQARDLHFAARQQLERGDDPKASDRAAKAAKGETFALVAEEYLSKQGHLAPRTLEKARWQLREFVNPHIGEKPISTIDAPTLLAVLRRIEARGKIETAHKTKELCGRVFLYGVATGRCERNVAADLKGALKARENNHHPAITDKAGVGQLLRAIDAYAGQPGTHAALRLLPHVFLRPGELRAGRWCEVDFVGAQWVIPAERMKMKRDHVVPLSRQAVAILREIETLTGGGEYIFPAIGAKRRPISDGTLGNALRLCGYSSDQHVPHGFRVTASTMLHDLGFDTRDIELQLAHADKNKVRAIYNRSERIAERTRMMQAWSDYLDQLKADDAHKVTPIKRSAA